MWDKINYVIRRINQNRDVSTIAGKTDSWGNTDGYGTNAVFSPYNSTPVGAITADNRGNIYLVCGTSVRKIDAKTNVLTIAGNFTQTGYINGAGNIARFSAASGICVSGDTIYIADYNNQRIRSITNNPQPQIVTGANLGIGTFAGVTISGTVGRTYQIQSSTDMSTWTTRATILLSTSPYLWIDQNPVGGNKFYRSLLLP